MAPESNSDTFFATVHFAPMPDAYMGERSLYVTGISPDVLQSTLSSDIKAAVKAKMEDGGITFGILDTVRVIPGTL